MATKPTDIPFGEWLPDLPAHQNPGALIAKNVLPEIGGYRSLNSLASFSDALTGVCLGAFWAQAADNTVYNFAGDATKLYRLVSGAWSDISGLSAPFSAAAWEFTKFGDRVIATNKDDPMQYYDIGTSSVFAALAGSPPQAARIATVRDFVVVGDLSSLGPNWIQWCGFNNSELWTSSLATQSDKQELFGRGGRVQRIVPGEFGTIFQEHAINRMDYAGPPVIFQIDEVEPKRGTPAPGSVCWAGPHVFYYGWDGFYYFDGVQSHPISHNKVSRWFQRNATTDALSSMRAVVDRQNRMVIWAFRTSNSEAINNRLLIWNIASHKWSYAEVSTQIIEEYVSSGYTLDELDALLADIDSASISVDSTAYQGGALNVQAFNSSNQAATFSGSPMTATIDTKEVGRGLFCNSVEPQVESETSPTITVQIGTRDKLSDVPTFDAARSVNDINGEANVRKNGNYMRFRLNISGGFEHGVGVRAHLAARRGRR